MSRPLISVIVPAYNAARWVQATVRSILEQEGVDVEVIVVNDGSTDDTAAVVRAIGDPRVRLMDRPNGGVSTARNNGLDQARGAFIRFLDADDVMRPGDLLRKWEVLERTGADWVFADIQPCDPELRPTGPPMRGTTGDVVRTILSGVDTAVPAPCSNVLARSACYAHIRFDPALSNAADQDIALHLASGFRYVHLPEALTLYRVVPGSMSKNIALYERDHLRLMANARGMGLMEDRAFRRACMAQAYWSIAGSWWVNARRPLKALPFLVRAVCMRPALLLRPLRQRST